MNFYYDEWDSIAWRRSWNIDVLLWPHNEHWSTIPVLIWKSLFIVFGIESHIPYEAALLVAHVASVLLLFELIRRKSGDLTAFGAAAILLVLGTGGSDIVWAFQIGFVGSVAFGLLAILLFDNQVDYKHAIGGAAALTASLMCSSVGLAFLAAVFIQLILNTRNRPYAASLILPTVAFVAWYLAFDTGSIPGLPGASASLHHSHFSASYLASWAEFVGYGLAATAASPLGLRAADGLLVAPVVASLIALGMYRKDAIDGIAMAAGLIAWFSLTGLGRAQNGVSLAGDSHYIYVGAVFLLPLIANAIGVLPWRRLWRPAIGAFFAVAILGNVTELLDFTRSQADLMRTEDAELQTVQVFRGAPDMALYKPFDRKIMPQLDGARYFPAIDQLGSPVASVSLDALQGLPPDAVDGILDNLFGQALTVKPMEAESLGQCSIIDATGGSTVDLAVLSNEWFSVRAAGSGTANLRLSLLGTWPNAPTTKFDLEASHVYQVHAPNAGKPISWRIRLHLPPVGAAQICGISEFIVHDDRVRTATAFSGWLGPGWSSNPDTQASNTYVAVARSGSPHSVDGRYANDTFGQTFNPYPGNYDLWFRVRVADGTGRIPEMTLGLWDETGAGSWVGSRTFAPEEVGTVYRWVRSGYALSLPGDHQFQFQASIETPLTTNWYIDEALLEPAGASAP